MGRRVGGKKVAAEVGENVAGRGDEFAHCGISGGNAGSDKS